MLSATEHRLDEVLMNIADNLDISESRYNDAVAKYNAVGTWLDANDSPLHIYMPRIYAQGSFRLGTIIKPLSGKDEYDIDLVCHLEINKDNITQEELKSMVGDRLKAHEDYKNMLGKEGRRCWTLDYANAFHMDILPAIPDYEKLNDSILITDKKLRNWQHSNPKGYARWFRECMKGVFAQQRQILAETLKANIEDVPEWKVKTPLQRAIQILKRHRDIHFQHDKDDKPVSIIITTLAAHAYDNEDSIYEALVHITDNMPAYILHRNGTYWVPNPTNHEENFADKWKEYPDRQAKFISWLEEVSTDFEEALGLKTREELDKLLKSSLGADIRKDSFQHSAPTFTNVEVLTKRKTKRPVEEVRPMKPWGIPV